MEIIKIDVGDGSSNISHSFSMRNIILKKQLFFSVLNSAMTT